MSKTSSCDAMSVNKKEPSVSLLPQAAYTLPVTLWELAMPSSAHGASLCFWHGTSGLVLNLHRQVDVSCSKQCLQIIVSDDIINKDEEAERLTAEIKKVNSEIKRAESMLSNEKFISKAPESKVAEEKKKLENYKKQLIELEDSLKKVA